MKHIITIVKKELVRVFKDKRLLFMIFIFPGLMLYAMYSLMGNFLYSEKEYIIETKYMPTEIENILTQAITNIKIKQLNSDSIEQLEESKNKLKNNEIDLLIIFDEDFLNDLNNLSNVNVYYSPASTQSTTVYTIIIEILNDYKKQLQSSIYGENFELFLIESISAVDEAESVAQMYALILPFLIISFLFSGVTSVAPESIAGEKERGTIMTLLVTPVKRSYIALGKIIALSVLAILSALSSFIGVMISMPKLMNNVDVITNIYNFSDYVMILIILIVTSIILVSLVSILSCFAKNTKEASMYSMPLMIISMGLGMTSMLGLKINSNITFVIPLFNSIQILSEIFTFDINITHFIITILSNLVFIVFLIYVLTKMFNNEKIMFSK